MKTIKLEFDCGKAGKVTWEAPRDAFSSDLSDRQLQRMLPKGFRIVPLFFRLLHGLGKAPRAIMDQGMDEVEGNLGAIARRTQARLENHLK